MGGYSGISDLGSAVNLVLFWRSWRNTGDALLSGKMSTPGIIDREDKARHSLLVWLMQVVKIKVFIIETPRTGCDLFKLDGRL